MIEIVAAIFLMLFFICLSVSLFIAGISQIIEGIQTSDLCQVAFGIFGFGFGCGLTFLFILLVGLI